jgi:hypothetical protein
MLGMSKVIGRALAALLLVSAVTHRAPLGAQTVNPQAAALKHFGDRTRAYMDLHQKAASELASLDDGAGAQAVTGRRDALAEAIRRARPRAKQGDIFGPDAAPQFRAIIRADLKSREWRDAIAAVEEVSYRSVWVNMPWPQDAPRPTIPPRLLTQLYPLPEGLEYRLLNRHLVLLDIDAEIVVDFVPNVLPSSIRPRIEKK